MFRYRINATITNGRHIGIRTPFHYRFLRRYNMAWVFHYYQVRTGHSLNYDPPLTKLNRATSQWYLPHEIALRMSLYNMAQPVGAIISGAMQGALSTNLQGALGRAGWRWAFLINVSSFFLCSLLFHKMDYSIKWIMRSLILYQGVCTIFIALIGFILLPGYVCSNPTLLSHRYPSWCAIAWASKSSREILSEGPTYR